MEEKNEELDLLSTRNKKRFGKLVEKLSEKYSGVEAQNLNLKNENDLLQQKLKEATSPKQIEKKELFSEFELAQKEYAAAQHDYQKTKEELYPHSSATSSYGSEIIWFSVVVGLVFDFLLWKDIFEGKFGSDSWAERAERASAIIMAFSYAFICAQLGAAYAIKVLAKKRKTLLNTTEKEKEVYRKSTAKESFGINIILFILLTILATIARFTEDKLDLLDKVILSLAATTIGLVIAAISYWYTDVYEHFIKLAKNREQTAKKNFLKITKEVKNKYE